MPGTDANGNALNGSNYLRGIGISESDDEEENWDDSSQEDSPIDMTGVENRPEYAFENGAKYIGEWKKDVRHGYGK